jgi:hypothetical protein
MGSGERTDKRGRVWRDVSESGIGPEWLKRAAAVRKPGEGIAG